MAKQVASGIFESSITDGSRLSQSSTAIFLVLLLHLQTLQFKQVSCAETCTQSFECCGREIRDNLINCWGFQSCCYSNELIAIPVNVEWYVV